MRIGSCPREKEVSALVMRGQWPDASPAELRDHAAGCRGCGDVVLLMQSFQAARSSSMAAAMQDSAKSPAGVLWWRAQLRRRKVVVEQVSRPYVGAQIFAFSVTVAIAIVFAITQAQHGVAWLSWLKQIPRVQSERLGDLWASASAWPAWSLVAVGVGLAAVAVLSGLMLFQDRRQR